MLDSFLVTPSAASAQQWDGWDLRVCHPCACYRWCDAGALLPAPVGWAWVEALSSLRQKGPEYHSRQSKGTSYCGRVALTEAFANIQQLLKTWSVP